MRATTYPSLWDPERKCQGSNSPRFIWLMTFKPLLSIKLTDSPPCHAMPNSKPCFPRTYQSRQADKSVQFTVWWQYKNTNQNVIKTSSKQPPKINTIKYEVIWSITMRRNERVYTGVIMGTELKIFMGAELTNGLYLVLRPLFHCVLAWFLYNACPVRQIVVGWIFGNNRPCHFQFT